MSIERITEAVYRTVDEFNEQREEGHQVEKSRDTVLLGKASKIDSLGLVNLIVGAEEQVNDEFGVEVILVDERAVSQKRSPFQTIGTLIDYITTLLAEQGQAR